LFINRNSEGELIMGQIEEVRKKNRLLAMIIRNDYICEGVDFITPSEYSQQVAYMHHQKGKLIDAHVHNLVHRNVVMTQEVLLIKKGVLRVDFYDEYEDYLIVLPIYRLQLDLHNWKD